MKKIIITTLTLIVLVSCSDPRENTPLKTLDNTNQDYEIINVEGCEYIKSREGFAEISYGFMAHKGNCKNTIHLNK